MNLAHFYLWTFLGSAIFCTLLVLLGNALGAHLDTVMPLLHRGAYAIFGLAVVAIVVIYFVMRGRSRTR